MNNSLKHTFVAALCLTLTAIAIPTAHAQLNTGAAQTKVWTTAGSIAGPNMSQLVRVTPNMSPQAVAQRLGAHPVGARGIQLIGFTEDLTTLDAYRRVRNVPGASVPSPWIDQGIMSVAGRVDTWMTALAHAGASIDFAIVSSSATNDATRFDPYQAPGWGAIEADQRFTVVKNTIGSVNLPSEMANSDEMREKWDEYWEAEMDKALSHAVSLMVQRTFPEAIVVAENRYTLHESGSLTAMRAGGGFGTNEQPQMYGQGMLLEPFSTFTSLVDDAKLIATHSGRSVIPSVASPEWEGDSKGLAALSGSPYWHELLYHFLVNQCEAVVVDRGILSRHEANDVSWVLTQVMTHSAAGTPEPYTELVYIDTSAVYASAMLVGDDVHWRLSFAPGVTTLRVVFVDNSGVNVVPEEGGAGAWFVHSASQPVAYIGPPFAHIAVAESSNGGASDDDDSDDDGMGGGDSGGDSGGGGGGGDGGGGDGGDDGGGGGSGPPALVILYDHAPTPAFVCPVPDAAIYLAIYQNDADPASLVTADIDPDLVIAEINIRLAEGWTGEWGMLDFEDPFDAVLMTGPTHPLYQTAIDSLVNTIQAVKAAFPQIKWTYYGVPRIPYWWGGQDWAGLTEQQRVEIYETCTGPYAPVMGEMDWFMPSLYDKYERALNMPASQSDPVQAEREYRKACVNSIHHYFASVNQEAPPIVPVISPWFQPGGVATSIRAVPIDELCEEQIQPAIEAGVDGIAIWGAMEYFLTLATSSTLPPGYENLTNFCRWRFGIDYYGTTDPTSIDWFDPATYDFVGGHLNQTMSDALEAIQNNGIPPGP